MALEEASHTGFPQPFFTVNDLLSALEYHCWEAFELPPFVEVVIRAVFGNFCTVAQLLIRIPDGDIRICPGKQRPFLGIQSEDFSRIGAMLGDKLIGSEVTVSFDRQHQEVRWGSW